LGRTVARSSVDPLQVFKTVQKSRAKTGDETGRSQALLIQSARKKRNLLHIVFTSLRLSDLSHPMAFNDSARDFLRSIRWEELMESAHCK
jgi:hypothetical protein